MDLVKINSNILEIIVYGTHTCPHCKQEFAWLDERQIPYEIKFVDDDQEIAKEMFTLTNQLSVPVTVINYTNKESEYIINFDQETLQKTLF